MYTIECTYMNVGRKKTNCNHFFSSNIYFCIMCVQNYHSTLLYYLISGVGDLSIWDFSGYEPYYMLYDHFMGDTNCINIVMFNLCDDVAEQVAQVIFWLGFIKGRISPQLPLGKQQSEKYIRVTHVYLFLKCLFKTENQSMCLCFPQDKQKEDIPFNTMNKFY